MSTRELLYAQLPSIYRRRDAEQGEPLRALLAILDEQLRAVQADIETTWDNWFVETAEEWLVPYLGQALGLPVTRDVNAIAFSRRAFVANAIRYRRGKGTAATLELLARDLTNYPTRVVELFTRMAWNEAINHQTSRHAWLDIRSTVALERLDGPFDTSMRTAEVRRIASGRGMVNLPNIALFMWRSQLWPVSGVNAEDMGVAGVSAWWFRPVGGARPLYAPLETEVDPAAVATEASVPLALSRRRLWEQARQLGAAMRWPFSIAVHGDGGSGRVTREVPRDRIDVCNLDTIPPSIDANRALIDPERGALVLGANLIAGLTNIEVVIDHFIATPGDIGAGPWDRDAAVRAWLESWTAPPEARHIGFQALVVRDGSGAGVFSTIDTAVQAWNAFLTALPDDVARSQALGLIVVGDSRTHAAPPARAVRMPTGAVLGIIAARIREDPNSATPPVRGALVADALQPVMRGTLRVQGQDREAANRGELYINGLLIDGRIRVQNGALQGLRLGSTTVLGTRSIDIEGEDGANVGLNLRLERSVVHEIVSNGSFAGLAISDSAVTARVEAALTTADISASTVLGPMRVSHLTASSCIFDDVVTVEQQQGGCIRFSYVAAGSRTPRRFRCQPDMAIDMGSDPGSDPDHATLARLRVRPQFVSLDPHGSGFLLLAATTPIEVREAAEDGGEPGCWNHLQHGIRLANLVNALPQFLRFGLEPGIFFLV
jgi:phage tail-like protein